MRKIERTRLRLQNCALDVCEREGFDNATVAQIAAEAGVSHMTFFRHFATKENAVLWDPFDPVIAESVRAHIAPGSPALQAVCRGVWSAWRAAGAASEPSPRRRARLVAASPTLRAALWASHAETETAMIEALREGGHSRREAAAAAGACLGALVTVLLDWADDEAASPIGDAIGGALQALLPEGIAE